MVDSAPEIARRVADALEVAGIPYAIGGALALGVWAVPRATNDVDINLFVPATILAPALQALRGVGCEFDEDRVLQSAVDRGDLEVRLERMRVDIFVLSIPLSESARDRARQAVLLGRPAWFLAPEDLAAFKFLFFRTKDILDVERLVAFLGQDFDRDYVRRWLVDLVGEDDERVSRWDQLVVDTDRRGD